METTSHSPEALLEHILHVTEEDIVPLTRAGVSSGSKVFGAAILARDTLKPITVATNDERTSPLLHGEINCIQKFFAQFSSAADSEADAPQRPDPRTECVFFATHEPCSLCLSGITWAGFSQVYFLFTYEDSRDLFAIPHDINILEEVFRVPSVSAAETEEELRARPLYNRQNKFMTARPLAEVVEDIADEETRERWRGELERVKGLYGALSQTYQEGKEAGVQSSSVWK